jgi:transposase-like protein
MLTTFKNLADMQRAFPDEKACVDHFRMLRWPDGEKIVCPHCGVIGKPYTLSDNTHKCRDCRRKFTVRNGTIFEDSKIDLRRWYMAIFLTTSHKKGVSSCQLARDIGVTQKTAWFMLHRIRNAAMTQEFNAPLSGTVEVDECYVGPKPKWQHASKKKGLKGMASAKANQKIVFAMQQREGDLRVAHVPNVGLKTTIPLVMANIRRGSHVHTDETSRFHWMDASFEHFVVSHKLGQYVDGNVTTNRVEGAFSHFRRTMVGTYHKCSVEHLDRYLQMFAFRWNRRKETDEDRMNALLARAPRRRLTYKALVSR